MEHHVAAQDVTPRLGLHLGVDGVGRTVDLAEDVERFEAEVEAAFQDVPAQRGAPNDVVRVEPAVRVAPAAVHVDRGAQVELPRQGHVEVAAVAVIVEFMRSM